MDTLRKMRKTKFAFLEELKAREDPTLQTGIPQGTLSSPGGYNPLESPVQGNAGAITNPPFTSYVDNRQGDPNGVVYTKFNMSSIDPSKWGVTPAMIALVVGGFVIYSMAGKKKKKYVE